MTADDPGVTFTALLHAVDALQWDRVRGLFADQVRLDYTSLFGGEVETLPADEVISRWQSLLPGFDATQHLTGPIVLDEADGAEAADGEVGGTTTVRAYHRLADGEGTATWMVAGRYRFAARRRGAAWLVSAITLTVSYEDGDRMLTEQAAQRVAAGAGGRVPAR